MSFLRKVELKKQLRDLGIKCEGNYVRKSEIVKVIKAANEDEEFEFDVNLDNDTIEELDAIANDPKYPHQLREYAKKSAEAKRVRLSGKIQDALKIERQLDLMYNALPKNLKSW